MATVQEALVSFQRQADRIVEQAEAVQLGLNVCRSLVTRVNQLEALLKEHNIEVPTTGTGVAEVPKLRPLPKPNE